MLILVDKKIPEKALRKLSAYGEVILFETNGITYDAVSGHPDIFFCQTPDILIVAPNTPGKYIDILIKNSIEFTFGNSTVGHKYPETARYNALVTDSIILHCISITEINIINLNVNKQVINVNQGYSRCNCIVVNNQYLTSDMSIFKALSVSGCKVTYVNPSEIYLKDFKNGFFGGCCGVLNNKLFVCGSIDYLNPEEVTSIYNINGIEIIQLCDEGLFDVGGILFLQ
ncbi:MAG: hypothetical protein KGZ97_01180 [Bacteroidetes bacterium]|nr:hypothetical protein [Bacteroidota bacterium]